MPMPAELQARIDALRGNSPDTEAGRLQAKLRKRQGQPGYAANVDGIRAKLSELGEPDEGEKS